VNEKCHGISSHLERKKGKQKRQAHSVQAVGVQQARAQAAPVPPRLGLVRGDILPATGQHPGARIL
jgi:hypothetical protein